MIKVNSLKSSTSNTIVQLDVSLTMSDNLLQKKLWSVCNTAKKKLCVLDHYCLLFNRN